MSSEEIVRVPSGNNDSDAAVLLLAAAETLGHDAGVVEVYTDGPGGFTAPQSVVDLAFGDTEVEAVSKPDPGVARSQQTSDTAQAAAEAGVTPEAVGDTEPAPADPAPAIEKAVQPDPVQPDPKPEPVKPAAKKAPAKKAPAKKAASKRAPAKKAAAKKTVAKSEKG